MDDPRARLRAKNIRPRDLARSVEITENYLHRLLTGSKKPSGDLMARLIVASRHALRIADFFPTKKAAPTKAA